MQKTKNSGRSSAACSVLLLILLTLFAGGGCSRQEGLASIDLPPTPLLSMRERWGVINSSHLRMRSGPDQHAEVLTTFWNRREVVLEVLSQSTDKGSVEGREGYWYQVSYDGLIGWVFGGYVDLYGTKEQALRAARESL